jgi:Zc3h12a-like Ribonuclease NYN domain
MPEKHHVVVDGSNLATEGRTMPSLAQLDEAVRSYAEEDPQAEIVVVVDASFGHRIDAKERKVLDEAELHGEIVSPPAGAIGRGDAFVLRIAERTGAVVLSNDSFQEFHGEHPWLFEEGRLVGGKPVPGVGWIFTPRSPVRGAKSRQAVGKSKRHDRSAGTPAAAKAAELAKAAKKVAARRAAVQSDGSKPSIGDVWVPTSAPGSAVTDGATAKDGSSPTKKATKAPAKKATKAAKTPAKAAKKTAKTPAKVAKKATKAPAKKATKAPAKKATKAAKKAAKTPAKAAKPAKKTAKTPAKVAKKATKAAAKARNVTKRVAKATKTAVPAAKARKASKSATRDSAPAARVTDPELVEAIVEATAEALDPPPPERKDPKGKDSKGKEGKSSKKKGKTRRRNGSPPPAVNEPLAFINFVATYPIGSEVEGEVASFTSHGAMVEVALPDGGMLHCYIPLSGLGRPAPHKAREVLRRGERRRFELVSLDPPRRVAELVLPGLAPGSSAR